MIFYKKANSIHRFRIACGHLMSFFRYFYNKAFSLQVFNFFFEFTGLSHDNNINNSTKMKYLIIFRRQQWKTYNLNAMRIFFIFYMQLHSFQKEKRSSTIFVWENSVLGRNKTKIVKKNCISTIFFKLAVRLRMSRAFRNRNWPGINGRQWQKFWFLHEVPGGSSRFLEDFCAFLTNLCN